MPGYFFYGTSYISLLIFGGVAHLCISISC